MSQFDRHIIQKLHLELKTGPDRASVQELQSKASDIVRHQLSKELESLFAEFSDRNYYIFDRLEISLGKLNADRFEEELLEKLKKQLNKTIRSVDSGNVPDATLLSEDGYHHVKMLHYLATGILPWYASDSEGFYPGGMKLPKGRSVPADSSRSSHKPEALSDQLKRLLQNDPDRLKKFLLSHRHDRNVMERTMSVFDPVSDDLFKLITPGSLRRTVSFYSLVKKYAGTSSLRDIRIAFLQTILQTGSGKPYLLFFLSLDNNAPAVSGELLSALKKASDSATGAQQSRIYPLDRNELEDIQGLASNIRMEREPKKRIHDTDSDSMAPELTNFFKRHAKSRITEENDKVELLNLFQKLLREQPGKAKQYLLSSLHDYKVMEGTLAVFEPILEDLIDACVAGLQKKVTSLYSLVKNHSETSSLRDIRLAFLQTLLLTGSGKPFRLFILTFFLRLDRNDPDVSDKLLSALNKKAAMESGVRPAWLHPLDRTGLEEILVLIKNTRSGDREKAASARAPDKSAIKKKDTEIPDGTNIGNAGLVLLSPFFTRFFANLELVSSGSFLDDNAQQKAMQLLGYLESGEEQLPEFRMVLIKLLCGFSIFSPPHDPVSLSTSEKREAEILIESAIAHWKALKKTTVEGFRESFIRRDGVLRQEENIWKLHVERKAYDILLDRIPWTYTYVKLPWMERPLMVEW